MANNASPPDQPHKQAQVQAQAAIDIPLLQSRFSEKNIRTLLEMFIASSESEINELSTAAANADWQNLQARAHAFKGACTTICATSIARLLGDLESKALSSDDKDKFTTLAEIQLELTRAVAEASSSLDRDKRKQAQQ